MSMAFTEGTDSAGPTHKVVTRDREGVDDWDGRGHLTVENRVLESLLGVGTDVRLSLDRAHDQFDTVQRTLTLVEDADRILLGSGTEFCASLPADRPTVVSLLDCSGGETAAWTDRLFNVESLAVLTDETWLYRSVPHEPHIRELNEAGHDEVIEELEAQLHNVPGAGVVPVDGLVSWTADGTAYTLHWDVLSRTFDQKTISYDLARLSAVTAMFSEQCLCLDWQSNAPNSLVWQRVRQILGVAAASPPKTVCLPDGPAGKQVFESFSRLRDALDYDYECCQSPGLES